jgi:hypothetical protein
LTDEAFDVLNFSETEKMDCYKIMAAIMHMGGGIMIGEMGINLNGIKLKEI